MNPNQISVQLQSFLKTLPALDYAFAYGSAVQPQHGYDYKKKPMVDIILSVDDTMQWHKENLVMNKKHYSGLGYYMGSQYIHSVERQLFPVNFSPFIGFEDIQIKYGVTSTKQLCQDLTNWNWMTIAGRMQKPILELENTLNDDSLLYSAQQINLRAAFATCLLLDYRPSILQDEQLYNIMSLSYIGDIRFALGSENQQKVYNILQGNFEKIQAMYNELIIKDSMLNQIVQIDGNNYKINTSDTAKQQLISLVPYGLIKNYSGSGKNMSLTLAMSNYLGEDLREMIRSKNEFSSKRMLVAHMLTVSPLINIKYGYQKLMKRFNK